jgi:predicted nucleic acid-binding protein
LTAAELPEHALLLMDSAPINYVRERHPTRAQRFMRLFEAHAAGQLEFAVTTMTLAEVLTGPLQARDETPAWRFRAMLESLHVVDLDADIVERAARLHASLRLRLADAVQAASTLAINADAIATDDRGFSRVRSLRVICQSPAASRPGNRATGTAQASDEKCTL